MGRQDRLDLLLQCVKHVVFDVGRRDAQFAIIGDGECFAATKARARELGIQEWITFTDWLPEEGVFRYLATADLGIDAGMQAEVSPVKAMEYMAFGLPTVTFDLKETKAIADGAAAYATPGDSLALARTIDSLLDDPQRRAEMGDAGRLRVTKELAWDRQAIAYLRAIEDVLSRRVRRLPSITDDRGRGNRTADCSRA